MADFDAEVETHDGDSPDRGISIDHESDRGPALDPITLKHRTLSPVVQLFIDHARMVAKTMRQ
ncbi:MAG TPA: hypothetical protein VKC66_20225 [Xanthobacteraceae bacterium]|nr:hypothetical protein [Xanthobacteraceae bacterium]